MPLFTSHFVCPAPVYRWVSGSFCSASRAQLLWRGGFSLLESMVVVSLLALTLTLMLPAWLRWQRQLSLQLAVDELQQSIHFARMLALAHQETSTLCPSRDGQVCSGGRDFSSGWIVLQQGRVQRDHAPRSGLSILANAGMTADVQGLVFTPSSLPTSNFAGMTVRFHWLEDASAARCLVLARSARLRVQDC